MSLEKFNAWYWQLQQEYQQKGCRNLVVLVGEPSWQISRVNAAITSTLNGLVYSDAPVDALANFPLVNAKNYTQQLGTEQNIVVFNVGTHTTNFQVNAFAALSGTIVAGGSLFLLVQPMPDDATQQHKDYFFQRFSALLKLKNAKSIYFFQQNDNAESYHVSDTCFDNNQYTHGNDITAKNSALLSYGCITHEQVKAVDTILNVLTGHRNRPLVLTADRGRGKSSALAIAVCQMLTNGSADKKLHIILTAPNRQSVVVIFQYLEKHLSNVDMSANSVSHDNGELVFLPIDQVLKQNSKASLVLVDEAAGFPLHLLAQLLKRYHRLVFSSTVHGYEGAGRGFSIKFHALLNRNMPQWRKLHINEAIRWASDDPLEAFVFKSCLLNAELDASLPALVNMTDNDIVSKPELLHQRYENLQVRLVTSKQLINDEALLAQVFSVLVTAHYQTSPSDLQLLLNNQAVSVFVLMHMEHKITAKNNNQPHVLGVTMLIREGQMAANLVAQVKDNNRRIRDQFIPQSLLTHCGIKNSFEYSYQRVMRIAIHPALQQQGLGRYFLTELEKHVKRQGVDFLAASFAGNAYLLKFWQQSGFTLARIGFSKDKASGEHSCLVIKSIADDVATKQQEISQCFYQQFDYWLTDEFSTLSATMVWQVLHYNHANKDQHIHSGFSDLNHQQAVNDFVSGQRQFSSCVYSLHQWLLQHCLAGFDSEVLPLISRILQKHTIEQVCADYGFTGKKSLNQHFINYVGKYS